MKPACKNPVLLTACIALALSAPAAAALAQDGLPGGEAMPGPIESSQGLASATEVEGGTQIMTPRYTVVVPDAMLGDGFTWEYEHDRSEGAPEGAVGVLTVRDASTGDAALIVYCLPIDDAIIVRYLEDPEAFEEAAGDIPGYLELYKGGTANRGDGEVLSVVFAVREDLVADADAARRNADGRLPAVDPSGGSYARVHGLGGTTESPDAYLAHATATEGGPLVNTRNYSVLVPSDIADGATFRYSDFEGWLSRDELQITCPGAGVFYVYCRHPEDAGEIGLEGDIVVGTTGDGMEVVVSTLSAGDRAEAVARAIASGVSVR